MLCAVSASAARTISFAGLTWNVRSGTGAPGNGCWSDDSASVWVDESGFLHLKIRRLSDGRWCQAQVTAQSFADYGDHLFYTNSRVDLLGSTTVLGLYLYEDDYHEIDIEITRAFGSSDRLWYAVQPYFDGAPRSTWHAPLSLNGSEFSSYSSHHFTWSADRSVAFGSWHGQCPTAPCGGEIAKWSYQGPNTPEHGWLLRPNINLWIKGDPPSTEQEVIVGRYRGPQVPRPLVTTGVASEVTSIGARLAGTVNPNGWSSSGWFEYGTSTSYPSTTEGSRESLGDGTAAASIEKAITGLGCGTLYHFRAVGRNVAGRGYGPDGTFTTAPCPAPVATTGAATRVEESSATLSGRVKPNGASTATAFEYGPTTAYGSSVAAQTVSGSSEKAISTTVSRLRCGTEYHFRVRASHPGGTSYGADASFTTGACSGTPPRWRPVRPGG